MLARAIGYRPHISIPPTHVTPQTFHRDTKPESKSVAKPKLPQSDPHRTLAPRNHPREPTHQVTTMAGIQMYNIAGKQVASHYLAAGILATFFGGVMLSTGGSKKIPAQPKIEASSTEEVDFIKKFLEENGEGEKKAH
jgi:F-type H+-transporting ATPase subunit k